ncbi:MAG TPA: mammalian cell entry protein [Mycobacterium sp.]|nr:mammalian cell entry protein [Mycobacterium sp.]
MSEVTEEVSDDTVTGATERAELSEEAEQAGESEDAAPPRPKWRLRPKNDDADSGPAGEAAAPVAPVTSKRRITGPRPAVAVAMSAALFVGAAAFAGAALQPYLADRAVVATKQQIVKTAVRAINTLWNYTPENMDTLADRASVFLSGDLDHDYRKFIDAIATSNKQAKVTDSTEITGAAVESLEGPDAVVLVYTNTSATSEVNKTMPSLKYQSHRLFMKRDHRRWVITKMPTITSLNLTPKL